MWACQRQLRRRPAALLAPAALPQGSAAAPRHQPAPPSQYQHRLAPEGIRPPGAGRALPPPPPGRPPTRRLTYDQAQERDWHEVLHAHRQHLGHHLQHHAREGEERERGRAATSHAACRLSVTSERRPHSRAGPANPCGTRRQGGRRGGATGCTTAIPPARLRVHSRRSPGAQARLPRPPAPGPARAVAAPPAPPHQRIQPCCLQHLQVRHPQRVPEPPAAQVHAHKGTRAHRHRQAQASRQHGSRARTHAGKAATSAAVHVGRSCVLRRPPLESGGCHG